jgi:hypothetical protein
MKIIYPLLFIFMGCLFLLISTVFYPSITQLINTLQNNTSSTVSPFWDLALVVKFVRIIFLIVGIFLTGFGISIFWIKLW